ncbi:hypothetical protein N7492_002335 [Penicillium capsulatum]|uniref:Uncharacterized protein n=1 Tax=Penicillium capsulatum TaxID=69766 RepID=A0A9W9LVK7_9EURO|nr:hypothetical protein N7492_002335 [Penicillium capsulatum]KAJ6123059.1 hypothetical protein N7512_005524 [Penicillium capsulatum]
MPPAAPDDLFCQQSRSLEDEPFASDPVRTPPEHEPTGKSKKKKSSKKAKAKAAAETPPDDLIQPSASVSAEPSSCPDSSLEHHAPTPTVTPPVLDTLGSVGEAVDNDLTSRTDTWAQAVPYGKSPPTDLMDGELAQDAPLNFPTIQERGFSQPSSASPPTQIRPFSYGSGYRSSMQSRQHSVDRRKSHSYGSPMSNLAPLPHLPQAHFYGAPDVDLPGPSQPTTDGAYSFCGFDTLPGMSNKTPRAVLNVLVVGMDGAVEVLAVEDRQIRLIGQITGLNGRVIEAKILSGNPSSDVPALSKPQVAVIVHGPLPPNEEEGHASSAGSEVNEIPSSAPRGRSNERRGGRDGTGFYQTRVEIYSLRSGENIATLFESKPVPPMGNLPGFASLAPAPVGSLRLFTSDTYVIVASGVSGELFVYRQASSSTYQCLGKTWTNVQTGDNRRYSTSSSSTDPDGAHNDAPRTSSSEHPILALRGRWLAIIPPSSSSRGTVQGNVPANLIHGKAQGLETRSPPTMPSVNCATDVGEGESFLDKFARGVTQELVRGARWMGDQGIQAWNSYWNTQQSPGATPSRLTRGPDNNLQGYGLFPPTHAQDTQSSSPEPDTVSIIDLQRFDDGIDSKAASLYPMATFQVPNGCSFLSLSPNGLLLFTASKKGDVQYVWDLLQLKNCRAMASMADDQASQTPSARQVARYTRLTTSSIVDVIWVPPVGDRLAIITRKGTIHVFDLPRSAFQWPPFRRARPLPKSPTLEPASDDLSGQATGGNPISAAMKLVGGKTQPFFSAVRGRVPSSGAAFPNMSGFALPAAPSIKGGKVVAAGLSKSMGAAATGTVHSLRHVGDNRLHLTGLARDPAPARVIWICSKGQIFLGLVDDGYFKSYRLKRGASNHKNRQFHSVIGSKEIQHKLPASLQSPCGPAPLGTYDPERVIHASLLLPSAGPQPMASGRSFSQPLSQAEIETNTPYQPFHTDQRVGLQIFSKCEAATPSGQWVFGDDIPTTKVHLRSYSSSGPDAEEFDDDDTAIHGHSFGAGGDMENLITLGNSTGNVGNIEEVVITTRRKKKPTTPLKAEDGFFEDDCEVLDFARDRV